MVKAPPAVSARKTMTWSSWCIAGSSGPKARISRRVKA